jgi:hypothetical protein
MLAAGENTSTLILPTGACAKLNIHFDKTRISWESPQKEADAMADKEAIFYPHRPIEMVPSTPSASPALPPLFTPKLKLNLWTTTRITSATRVSWQNGVATSIHIRFPAEGFLQSFPLWASPVGGEALFLFRPLGHLVPCTISSQYSAHHLSIKPSSLPLHAAKAPDSRR